MPAPERRALDAFVDRDHARYRAAIARARGFLDALEVDPIELRAHHIKGKKKLVEALDAYYRLYQIAAPQDRAGVLERVEALARSAADDRYHDLLTVDDHQFREDATSYLRAAFLLDRMGIDVRRYRAAIVAIKGRLDAHMGERGPHQRRAFHTYYRHFALAEPFPLAGALEQGLIAGKADPERLSRGDAYGLTHEIFSAYDFGDALDAEPFRDPEQRYLRGALPRLLALWRAKDDPDLVAELVTCLRYLRFTGDPEYAAALTYLFDRQNPDGSWGSYASARARLGERVKQGFYLHTTMVAIDALTLGFDDLFRRGEGPTCP